MAWNLKGSYVETCSCDLMCPCNFSMAHGATYDYCRVTLAFDIKEGDVDGTDIGGTKVALICDTPKVMTEGNWRVGLFIDDQASDEQAEKLLAVFSGQMGGPMEALGPLVGEQLGVERLPMEVTEDGGRYTLRAGDGIEVQVEELVPFGVEDGTPATLDGVFHPAGSTLTIARTQTARWNVLGLDVEHGQRTSGFAAPFAWSG